MTPRDLSAADAPAAVAPPTWSASGGDREGSFRKRPDTERHLISRLGPAGGGSAPAPQADASSGAAAKLSGTKTFKSATARSAATASHVGELDSSPWAEPDVSFTAACLARIYLAA